MTYLSLAEILIILGKAKKRYDARFKSPDAKPHDKRFAFHAKIVINEIEKDICKKADNK